ncbi:HAD superfamily hydrolase [Lacticaseibacillus pantheris DSM 15945 = JCM 12539 = NBRC 106106]|uniref:HAD superfamily hydrolase n=1 Tax=Lacticaseibacillus pantheris DSM 15945 = JCM 12539 = NBRC 106106 TaxID=1423783 RepID=A0A0R1TX59_9LACO|nr:HAD family hydrolase [Lacticaseibacillus pantheris]KRL85823.1 HAD superfamily hydrolase [Lacticaseibacillus pantheris DSM 15945 = JCM 12539 = NBRC 106106]
MSNNYAIFSDIDGTLVDNQQQVSPTTIRTINSLIDQHHHFSIATGRMLESGIAIAQQIGTQVDVIASNGAVIHANGQTSLSLLGANALRTIYPTIEKYRLSTFFFTTNRVFYTNLLPDYFSADAQQRVAGTGQPKYAKVNNVDELVDHQKEIVNGIVISDENPPALAAAKTALSSSNHFDITSSSPNNIEILPHDVTKATAVQRYCELVGVPLNRSIAFGDGLNDLPMLKAVAVGVAMGNAQKQVQQSVPNHTQSNLDDGVANFLNKYFEV